MYTIMTNASMKKINIVSVLSVIALSVVISVGAFATTVHAQEDVGYYDTPGDNIGYYDTPGDSQDEQGLPATAWI